MEVTVRILGMVGQRKQQLCLWVTKGRSHMRHHRATGVSSIIIIIIFKYFLGQKYWQKHPIFKLQS